MSTTYEFIKEVSLFKDLPHEALEELSRLCRERSVEESSFFFMQGDEARHMYVVTRGRVKLTQLTPDGQQVGVGMVVPGQMFAGIAILNPQKRYPVSAQALEDSSALAWNGMELHEFANRYPTLSFKIMDVMRFHIEEMQSRYRELSTQRVEQRVARSLLRLTMQMGKKREDGSIEISLSQQNLAEMSGTTLFSVSRTLAEWERQELIETGRERIVIRKPHGLVKIADDLS
jgi:CRP-like cAMP-binding protein